MKKKGLINGSTFEELLRNAADEGIISVDKIEELKEEIEDLEDDLKAK